MNNGTIALPDLSNPHLPDWLPAAVRLYLDHTEDGFSFRALARREGRHASTIMCQVRRYESRRDDPLLDEALAAFSRMLYVTKDHPAKKDTPLMSAPIRHAQLTVDDQALDREGRRILRRLAEPGAVLAIAPEMEKAVVLREFADGRTMRTGVLDRAVAQAFTLKDWISCRKLGRVSTYEITSAGRSPFASCAMSLASSAIRSSAASDCPAIGCGFAVIIPRQICIA